MISEQAKRSIDAIFVKAATTRLLPRNGSNIEVVLNDSARRHDALQPHALVLTISSMTFRMLFVLHFADDRATRDCYLDPNADRDLTEVLMEQVNLCCGSVNQQLVAHYPDLGMSTPYALSSRCIDFLDELKPDHVWDYELRIGDAARFDVTLCVCAKAEVDFSSDDAGEVQEEGELELF
jgi:hypothetical protein